MIERPYLKVLEQRIKEPRKFLQVITGPRQIGKTTLVIQLAKKLDLPYTYVSADGVAATDSNWLVNQWETARLKVRLQDGNSHLLIIDEIQKIEQWSETVKKLWDEDSLSGLALKVIILGSSRLMLQMGLTESLAGRFESTYMGHWTLPEMRDAFGWDAATYAWFGGYPGAADLIKDETRWRSYIKDALIETSISKDILMLTRIDKPALMKRLFELGCLYSGQILSYTKIMGQLQDAGNTTTLANYLRLLDTAGLLGGLEKYGADLVRKRSSSPKFQVHNMALLSGQSQVSLQQVQTNPTEWGRIVESAVGAHLINSSYVDGIDVYYWREGIHEVDFVLQYAGKTIAIEVKTNLKKPGRGMDIFRKKFNPDNVLLIGQSGIPWEEFLLFSPRQLF